MELSQSDRAWNALRRKVGRAIAAYRMIAAGDRLLLGVSGGKDSMVLLKLLADLRRRSPVKFSLVAATFDPGFSRFNCRKVADFARECGVEFVRKSLPVAEIIEEKRASERPCVLCSRLRRGVLYATARELGCGKLVLAHHLDDIAVSLLIGLFRGQGLTTMTPNAPTADPNLRVIRPLAFAEEREVALAAKSLRLRFGNRCPYEKELKKEGDRAMFARELAKLEKRIPHVRQLMLKSMSDVRPDYLLDLKFLKLGDQE